MAKMGRPSKGVRAHLQTRVSPTLAEQYRQRAARTGRTVSEVLAEAAAAYLAAPPDEPDERDQAA